MNDGIPTPAVQVTDRVVMQDAVDSQQPGGRRRAGWQRRFRFCLSRSRRGSIFSTHDRTRLATVEAAGRQIRRFVGPRERVHPSGRVKVYGYIYDAGSDGGAGMNRFAEIELPGQ